MTLPSLYMLVAIRHAESSPDRGKDFAVLLKGAQTQIALALQRRGLVACRRASAPQSGNLAALTDAGRALVDSLLAVASEREVA